MKIYSKLLAALALVPFMAGLTSCGEDHADYSAAQKLANAQVYFDAEVPQTVELNKEANSFDVTLHRVKTDGELTVELNTTQSEESTTQLNVPASVTFPDGESEVTFTVTYNPETIEFEDKNNVTIAIGDETYTTPYGFSAYEFTAYIPEPWTEWCYKKSEFEEQEGQGDFPLSDEGKGDYTYGGIYFDGDDPGLPVSFRQNKLNPLQGQFKIEHWGSNVDLILPAEWDEENQYWRIYVPQTDIGAKYQGEYEIYVGDYIAYYEYIGKGTLSWDILKRNGLESYYDPATGKFTLYVLYYLELGGFGEGNEYFQVGGFYVPDYTTSVSYAGVLTTPSEESQAVVDFTLGVDVASAKYLLTDASQSESNVAQTIVEGEVAGTEITESGRYFIPLGEDGKYRVTLVSYDAEGNALQSASCVFEFAKGGSLWESLGMHMYTDDLMTMGGYDEESGEWGAAFRINDPVTYPVEVLVNSKKPGLYRLKNAYGEANPYNEEGDWDTSMDYYLEIDATDPNYVMINKQELGCNWYDLGMMSVESDGSYYVNKYGMTPAEIVAAITEDGGEDPFGKLANGIITFPAADVFEISFGEYAFLGNHNSAFKVDLNEEAVEGGETKAARFVKRMRHYTKLANMSMRQKARKVVVAKRLNTKSARIIK